MIKNIPILLYHSVNENSSPHFRRWVMHPQDFDRHIAFLVNEGYIPMLITDIARRITDPAHRLPERVVGVTFDDGFEDFYTQAMPILTHYNVPATIYIATGYIGRTSRWLDAEGEGNHRMMNWAQIKEIDQLGIEIGAHSMHHLHLDTLPINAAYREIIDSRRLLEQNLGHPVLSFAYPHGYYSRDIQHLVKSAGYTSACAVKHGLSSPHDDPFALARIIIGNTTTIQDLRDLLKGNGLLRVQREERVRTRVWRVVRRVMHRLKGFVLEANDASERDSVYGKPTNQP